MLADNRLVVSHEIKIDIEVEVSSLSNSRSQPSSQVERFGV